MTPFVTPVTSPDAYKFDKPLFEQVIEFVPSTYVTDSYFILTDNYATVSPISSDNVVTYSLISARSILTEQINFITIANLMFQDSKPMVGNELRILKYTASRLISKTPTSLRKK